jgi:SecD/SecF fusion protein
MNEYVIEEITPENFNTFLPTNEPGKSEDKTKDEQGQWLVLSLPSAYDANLLYNQLLNFNITNHQTLPLKPILTTGTANDSIIVSTNAKIVDINKSFLNNIFSIDPLLGAVIALFLIILMIGIIVSILYRVPGAYSIFFILLNIALTLVISISAGYTISLGILTAIFIGIILNLFCFNNISEKIKKFTYLNDLPEIGFKKGLKSSFWHTIDLHIISILACVGFVYFGVMDIQTFGVSLIIYSAFSLITTLIF